MSTVLILVGLALCVAWIVRDERLDRRAEEFERHVDEVIALRCTCPDCDTNLLDACEAIWRTR